MLILIVPVVWGYDAVVQTAMEYLDSNNLGILDPTIDIATDVNFLNIIPDGSRYYEKVLFSKSTDWSSAWYGISNYAKEGTLSSSLLSLTSGTTYYLRIKAPKICQVKYAPRGCWGSCTPTPDYNWDDGTAYVADCTLERTSSYNPVAPTTNIKGPVYFGGDGSMSFVAP